MGGNLGLRDGEMVTFKKNFTTMVTFSLQMLGSLHGTLAQCWVIEQCLYRDDSNGCGMVRGGIDDVTDISMVMMVSLHTAIFA